MAEIEIKHRDRILEAIDQLRRRKARPDSPRICNYMMRRFNVDAKEAKSDLQKCVESEIVFKVEYKGDISYRNAAKWNQKHRSGEIIDPTAAEKKVSGSFSKIVALSVSELICQEPDFLELGVPGQSLIKTIIAKSLIKYNKKHLILLLQREVENGGLVKLENGHYSLGSNAIDTDKSDDEYGNEDNDMISLPQIFSLESAHDKLYGKNKPGPKTNKKDDENDKVRNGQLGFRVGSRRKLAKKVFDPSDNNLPKRKRGRPVGSLNKSSMTIKQSCSSRPGSVASNASKIEMNSYAITCSICHHVKKPYEPIISCRDCGVKNHLACFQNNPVRIENEMNNIYTHPGSDWSSWHCSRCKLCVTCFKMAASKPYVTCSMCQHAYHYDCHNPKLDIKPFNENWICFICLNVPIKSENHTNDVIVNNENSRSSPLHHTDSSNISTSPPALSPQDRLPNDNQSNSSSDYKIDNVSTDDNVMDEQHMMQVDEENNDSNKSSEATDDLSYDPSIPDATSWTHEDVYEYFRQFFPQEAAIFRDQEIDGHSLLLMKRSDVLSNLNLKLGPALKIYRHVLRLQLRRDYVKLGWF